MLRQNSRRNRRGAKRTGSVLVTVQDCATAWTPVGTLRERLHHRRAALGALLAGILRRPGHDPNAVRLGAQSPVAALIHVIFFWHSLANAACKWTLVFRLMAYEI